MQKKGLFRHSVFSRHSLQNGDLTNSPPLPSESKLWAASGAPGAASGGILFVSFSALEPSRWSKSARDLKITKNHLIFDDKSKQKLKMYAKTWVEVFDAPGALEQSILQNSRMKFSIFFSNCQMKTVSSFQARAGENQMKTCFFWAAKS